MKKILLAMCTVSALLFSCKEKNTEAGTPAKEQVSIQNTAESMIIYSGWVLSTEKDDGKMYAVREAETGDHVKIYLNEDGTIEQKTATRHFNNGKEDEVNMVRVQFDGDDYWSRDIFLSGLGDSSTNCYNTPAVVITDTFAYDSPSGTSLTSRQLKEGTLVAFMENQAEGYDGFFKVVIYNGNPFGKQIWLKNDTLTAEPMTIEIVRTFEKLNRKVEKEADRIKPEIRNEILWRLINDSGAGTDGKKLSPAGEEFLTVKLAALLASTKNSENPLPEDLAEKIANLSFEWSSKSM